MFFNFFRTAPIVQSDIVRKLDAAGRTRELLQAIEAERRNLSNTGSSINGQIVVQRVGSYKKMGR